jgi:hypothetical protein
MTLSVGTLVCHGLDIYRFLLFEEVAFTAVAVGVVWGVGFGGGAGITFAVVFVAVVGVVFFEDGFCFGDLVVDAGEDDAAGVFFGLIS